MLSVYITWYDLEEVDFCWGQHGGVVVSTVASQLQVLGLNPPSQHVFAWVPASHPVFFKCIFQQVPAIKWDPSLIRSWRILTG